MFTRRLLLGGISVTAAFLLHLSPTSAWHVLTKFNPLILTHLRDTAAANTITPTLNRTANHKVRLLRLSDWLEVTGSILSIPNSSFGCTDLQPWAWTNRPLWLFATCWSNRTSPFLFYFSAYTHAYLPLHFSMADLGAVAASLPITWANACSEEEAHSCAVPLDTQHRAKVSSDTVQPHTNWLFTASEISFFLLTADFFHRAPA